MKESITKFDLESAFKALDEIEIPKAGKVRANKPALTEIFSRKSKFDALMEEYYDISSNAGLEDAKDAREAEIAQAKLERIEKIVDLDAESAEDLLTSYVGKFIMQCPQCMTLFYKNQEDVVASEEDPTTVNINEVCQHCGNDSGYSLIGKVGEAEPEVAEEPIPEEIPEGDLDLKMEDEEPVEDDSVEDLDFSDELEELDLELDEEPTEEEDTKEESFDVAGGQPLNEELADDKELDAKLEAHNEYIEYLRNAITQEEEKLEKATNEQVKVAIQRNIDAFKADLENALPEAVKNDIIMEEEPANEEEPADDIDRETEFVEENLNNTVNDTLTEALLTEGTGADTKAVATAIANELAKDDGKKWAQTAKEIIDVIPDDFADELFDAVKGKANDIKVSKEQKKQLVDASNGELTEKDVGDCDTLGKILAIVDAFEWAKNKPGLLKSFILIVLGIVNIFEPFVVVEIIMLIIGFLPAEFVAKIFAILNVTTPTGLIGTAANKIYKKHKADQSAKVEEPLNNENKNEQITEAAEASVSDEEFEQLMNSSEFKKPISDTAVRAMLAMETDEDRRKEESLDTVFNAVDELQEAALESMISDSLVEMYGNVAGFRLKDCSYTNNKFMVEGIIHFTSGNTRKTTYTFNEAFVEADKVTLRGLNEKLGADKHFYITGYTEDKTFITESLKVTKK